MPTRSGFSREQRRGERLDALVVVAPLADRQKLKCGKVAGDDLLEADLALDMVAKRDRSGDQADLAGAAGEETAEKRAGGAAGGGIVDADIVGAAGARRVGDEGDDGDAGCGEIVDRFAHRRVVEGDHGDAVDLAVEPVERGGEHLAVEDVDMA